MGPWLAEVRRLKIIGFTYIYGYVWVCVYEWWTVSMGLCFHQVHMCVFLKFWWQRVTLIKEGCMPLPFESYGMVFCCLFMTLECKVVLVVDGMNFGCGRNELNDQMTWLIKFFLIYAFGVTKVDQKNSFIAGPKIQARRLFLTNQIHIFTYLF